MVTLPDAGGEGRGDVAKLPAQGGERRAWPGPAVGRPALAFHQRRHGKSLRVRPGAIDRRLADAGAGRDRLDCDRSQPFALQDLVRGAEDRAPRLGAARPPART